MEKVMITTTFYDPDNHVSRVRSEIAKRAFKNTIENGCPIVAVDGGSPDELLKEFESYGALILPEEQRGIGPARRQAIRFAYNQDAQAMLWAEPEKDLSDFLDAIFRPLLNGEADFLIPARKDRSSYPLFQQQTEGLGNKLWEDITGTRLDMFFGARAWKKDLSRYFLNYDGKMQDAIHIPVVDIVYADHNVKSVEIDFVYPRAQREIEESLLNSQSMQIKRLEQVAELSRKTLERWEFLQRVQVMKY